MRLRSIPWLVAVAAATGCAAPPLPALGPDDPASPLAREASLAPASSALALEDAPEQATPQADAPESGSGAAPGEHHGHH